MLHVFICEDRPDQRTLIEQFVNNALIEEDYNVGFAISFDNPTTLLDYLENNTVKSALYFLDVDLMHEINGIELGARIREMDASATIAFITTHSEMVPLVFEHKVEALDYIIKDNPEMIEAGIRECIKLAYERYLAGKHSQQKYFLVNTGGSAWSVPYDEILYFETNVNIPNKLIMHTLTGQIDFRGTLGSVTKSAPEFFACHRSFLVNPRMVKHIKKAKAKKMIELVNGEIIPVSKSRMPDLLKVIDE